MAQQLPTTKQLPPQVVKTSIVPTTTSAYVIETAGSVIDLERAEKRAQDLPELLKGRLAVDRADDFSMRPQKKLELFLNGRGPFAHVVNRGTGANFCGRSL